MSLWDISPPVTATSPVYPGDTPYGCSWNSTFGTNNSVQVSTVQLSPHVGAHADAPWHYDPQGLPIGALPLTPFIGHCRVVHARGIRPWIHWDDLATHFNTNIPIPPRILIRTYDRQPQHWDDELAGIHPTVLHRLADLGVQLIGTDSASIDTMTCTSLDSHQVARLRDLRILENLCLDAIAAGDYELIALPLKWMDCEASPVRAILRPWLHSQCMNGITKGLEVLDTTPARP